MDTFFTADMGSSRQTKSTKYVVTFCLIVSAMCGLVYNNLNTKVVHRPFRGARREQTANPRAHFITYGSGPFVAQASRLANKAKQFFDTAQAFSRQDLDPAYVQSYASVFNQARGDGYWLWKPYLILRALHQAAPGDIIFYADAGCQIVNGTKMHRYLELAAHHGMLGFRLTHLSQTWTKGDLFNGMGMPMDIYGLQRQHVGTVLALKKTAGNVEFVKEWLKYCEDPHFLTDSASHLPNHPSFKEHRHDQAILSLLIYKHGMSMVLEDETYPSAWLEEPPVIHAARIRDANL